MYVERTFRIDERCWVRPDIVVFSKAKKVLVVIDPHVSSLKGLNSCGRESDQLREYRNKKRNKYERHLPLMLEQLRGSDAEEGLDTWRCSVVPLVVSVFGIIFPIERDQLIEALGLGSTEQLNEVASVAALRYSSKHIHRLLWNKQP